jgi:glycosyltransferase involved in cell wall biosynthesis
MKSILILLHCGSNTGYAIGPLERTFYEMAVELCNGDETRVHFGYPTMAAGPSPTLPAHFSRYLIIDTQSANSSDAERVSQYISKHNIDTIFGFDQPVDRPMYRALRAAGVTRFVSYWGAPMSSIKALPVLLLKRLQVALLRQGPDHYVFESRGMADTAVYGRGIAARKTSVVPLGVDTEHFSPAGSNDGYLHQTFSIPADRKVFFYSGHMEPRKGVATIMQAANVLVASRKACDWHIVLLGNKGTEHLPYQQMLTGGAAAHVTFGGYRNDIHLLQREAYAAVIASTGWDSFPRSGVECQASGLPLIVSDLPGLNESIQSGITGFHFPTADAQALADVLVKLLDNPALRDRLSAGARQRVIEGYSLAVQQRQLVAVMRQVLGQTGQL